MHDLLTAAPGRSILLVTHRPEGLELVDDVVDYEASSTIPLTTR